MSQKKQNYEKPKKVQLPFPEEDVENKDIRHLPELMIHVNNDYITPFLYRW